MATAELQTPETVRVGLVGAGFVARAHTLAYVQHRLLRGPPASSMVLARIADIDQTRARQAALDLGWQSATESWRDVAEAEDVDLVDVVTPNDTHAEIAIAAATAGKDVLCEKPLAPDVDSARAMYGAVRRAGVRHGVAFVYRNWPAMRLAKRLIEEGRLGELVRFRGSFLHDYALDPDLPLSWRLTRSRAGAGSLGDVGSHLIDLARFLVGEIRQVMARSRTVVPHRRRAGSTEFGNVDVDDVTDVLLDFERGASGVLEANWVSAGSKTDLRFEVTGTSGAIRFSWDRPWELGFYSDDDPVHARGFRQIVSGPEHAGSNLFWPVAGHGLGWADAFTIFLYQALSAAADDTTAPTFLDGLRAAEVVDAAVRSACERRWVAVERTAS
jgi:predicted dehydrogenase